MNMDFWRNKVAVVTGACRGIGAQIAEDLTKIGMTVIGFEPTEELVAEMSNKLENFTNIDGQFIPCKCDISKEKDLINAFEGIVAAYGGVDLLINNAAIGRAGFICKGDLMDFKDVIDVNIYGLVACTRFAINSMIKKKVHGRIININSICGHYMPPFAEPKMNLYIVSKRFMTAFNQILKDEFLGYATNISVTSISPGIVRTGLFKEAGVEYINDEFFRKHPHLNPEDVSKIVLMTLSVPSSIHVNEIIFHALHEVY